jgi:hypothetical protein
MSGRLVSLAALRTARMLKENALPQQIDAFTAQMTKLARQRGDMAREVFWQDVAAALIAPPPAHPRRRSGGAHP